MKKNAKTISRNMLHRLPLYLSVARQLLSEGEDYVNAPQIAEITNINPETVKKDLSLICKTPGNPRLGRKAETLIQEIIDFGVYTQTSNAVIIGTGKLGLALFSYTGFKEWGLNFVAGFDVNPNIIGKEVNGSYIYDIKMLKSVIEITDAEIAVITVPSEAAQEVVNLAIDAGIKAIWNFASTHVQVPSNIILHNENMASSLALLNYNLRLKYKKGTSKKSG